MLWTEKVIQKSGSPCQICPFILLERNKSQISTGKSWNEVWWKGVSKYNLWSQAETDFSFLLLAILARIIGYVRTCLNWGIHGEHPEFLILPILNNNNNEQKNPHQTTTNDPSKKTKPKKPRESPKVNTRRLLRVKDLDQMLCMRKTYMIPSFN